MLDKNAFLWDLIIMIKINNNIYLCTFFILKSHSNSDNYYISN